jgi:hypothetical protein
MSEMRRSLRTGPKGQKALEKQWLLAKARLERAELVHGIDAAKAAAGVMVTQAPGVAAVKGLAGLLRFYKASPLLRLALPLLTPLVIPAVSAALASPQARKTSVKRLAVLGAAAAGAVAAWRGSRLFGRKS